MNSRRVSAGSRTGKDATRLKMEKMEAEREERRRAMQERKMERAEEERRNLAAGNPGDVDFIGLVRKWRKEHSHEVQELETSHDDHPRICICVRKRPIFDKERQKNDHDSVTCYHPQVHIHNAKFKVDGITKYIDHSSFCFDYTFNEVVTTEQVYQHSTMPLIDFVCSGKGGRATVFAYGQTGSGKTYTMQGLQDLVAEDLFMTLSSGDLGCTLDNTTVAVAFFEIYSGYVQDLLNNRNKLKVLEDGKGEIVVTGLEEFEAHSPAELLKLVENGNNIRTTHSTEANDTSSRSHAICQILLRDVESSKLRGKLSLVDLAGSERGSDTKSHNSQRRAESAEINTSLLALKECIRALDMNRTGTKHVPYRASKLTLILKDCFTSKQAKTTMIATVSPGASSADHTLNTLRYADRIKEKKSGEKAVLKNSASANKRKEKVVIENRTPVTKKSLEKPKPASTAKAEEDLRMLVQSVFEQEEEMLNQHMTNIKDNAQLLTEEGQLLQQVQRDGVSEEEIAAYAARLVDIIEQKTQMIETLEDRMAKFRASLDKEEELSNLIAATTEC
mmetsp:Transcript_34252/g.48677  ORF Transcript_34252/g.48677 Transcript_34252/m.48677 type:complete len:561 (+) Transcript_34252:74-1756(+)|eukprot:CAMPEP_0202450068 /NCGR_PEP_ID=MMETSP1360-20130828/8723_1 /ASSEMBLY_ACC=CAM_ASM_000848 /TAXON_ID=515479 /ORGANISM="Licmophora paradoxa, Strain CCMP2313" /LENGTH=560 /DNA_ID=CAMNT_0049068201 /DNA_START=55 /DNA_END=1737 /DNA_ORIENTATION=+